MVATFAPVSAVSYIQKFVTDHQPELDAHIARMEAGEESDPFLLILTQQRTAKFYDMGGAAEGLRRWLSQWTAVEAGHSLDYKKVAAYCAVTRNLADKFALRKVLDYEGATAAQVHPLLVTALEDGCSLSDVDSPIVRQATEKCAAVGAVIEVEEQSAEEAVARLRRVISIAEPAIVARELEQRPLRSGVFAPETEAEEAIETAGAAAAVQMLTMVGSKGLSAKHVIVIGCDDVNMARTIRLTFFVAMTRARESLHLITSLKAGGSTGAHAFIGRIPSELCNYVIYKKTGCVTESLSGLATWIRRLETWSRASRRR